jgi:hypothetical protein
LTRPRNRRKLAAGSVFAQRFEPMAHPRKTSVPLLLILLLPGCTYMYTDNDLAEETARKKAYDQCLRKAGGDQSRCRKAKADLLEQEEWEYMEESG